MAFSNPNKIYSELALNITNLLKDEEVAMIYDGVLDVVVSATPYGHVNLLKSLNLEPLDRIDNRLGDVFEFYKDEFGNTFALKYKPGVLRLLYVVKDCEESMEVYVPSIHIYPKMIASCNSLPWPYEIDLKPLIEMYKKNAINEVMLNILKEVSAEAVLAASLDKNKDSYIV